MVAHAFPPTGGSGVQRTAKFAKYFSETGWSPVVWCAPFADGLPRDDALLSELPDTLDRRVFPRSSGPARRSRILNHWRLQRLGDTLRRWSVPDDTISWAKRSLPQLLQCVKTEEIHAVYSTHSPASNHWLAWRIKQATGLPWVADFRDLWTDNYDFDPPTAWHRQRIRKLEDAFIQDADAVVGVSVEQTAILAAHQPQHTEKFFTIYNGADDEDFVDVDQAAARNDCNIAHEPFVVSFVGSFVQTAEAPAIIAAVKRCQQGRGGCRELAFRVVGWIPADMDRLLRESGVRYTQTGYVSHDVAIREMIAADCLICGNTKLGNNCDSVVPAKVFEYLMSGRSVIHVGAAESAVSRIFDDCGYGIVVPPDECRIGDALNHADRESRDGRSIPDMTRIHKYTRRAQTQQLADILNQITGATPANAMSASSRRRKPEPVLSH